MFLLSNYNVTHVTGNPHVNKTYLDMTERRNIHDGHEAEVKISDLHIEHF